jgi:hypothetical protein
VDLFLLHGATPRLTSVLDLDKCRVVTASVRVQRSMHWTPGAMYCGTLFSSPRGENPPYFCPRPGQCRVGTASVRVQRSMRWTPWLSTAEPFLSSTWTPGPNYPTPSVPPSHLLGTAYTPPLHRCHVIHSWRLADPILFPEIHSNFVCTYSRYHTSIPTLLRLLHAHGYIRRLSFVRSHPTSPSFRQTLANELIPPDPSVVIEYSTRSDYPCDHSLTLSVRRTLAISQAPRPARKFAEKSAFSLLRCYTLLSRCSSNLLTCARTHAPAPRSSLRPALAEIHANNPPILVPASFSGRLRNRGTGTHACLPHGHSTGSP